MRITDKQGTYQGFMEGTKFTQSPALVVHNAIKINQDVFETLRLEGCSHILTWVKHKTGRLEPFYLTIERFFEVARLEGEELVYSNPEEDYRHIDEGREVRENLYS
jgi:hypothetical protein